ncbi:RE1-silencing transcription factor [Tachysurus vachellii]|uniref:RE1-silencing transcription factor n=1 Tax=Tachysurus vachellii TaxID=175792 RepID=UPI00296A953A|nr:RE1-silencing transcription factor [Tachysurus vachellii]
MASQTAFSLCMDVFVTSDGASLPEESEVNAIPGSELPAPQLVMLANVALHTDSPPEEEKQMAELKNVGCCGYSDSEDENELLYSFEETTENVDDESSLGENSIEEDVGNVETVPTDLSKKSSSAKSQFAATNSLIKPTKKKKKPFFCKPCHFQAECEEEFVQHIRVHSAKKLIAEKAGGGNSDDESNQAQQKSAENCVKGVICCERCGYNTNRYDHYVAHLRHHKNEGDEQQVFRCTICPYSTVSQYHWKKHLRNHFPSKLFTCDQCSYFSDRKNNYIQHIRTHTGERPFQCVYCDYSSSQKTHLTRHMRTHSGERPFKCDSCSYLAANQHEVTRHARQVHNGPKPLNCPFCQYKTADRSNFKKHVELHVNPRQFLCPVCKYAASKKCNLQYHIKSRHPGCSDISMDVSKVRLRVKKADGDDFKPPPEPRMRMRQKADVSEDVESSAGPINLSIKKSGKVNLDGESGKKPASEHVKEKLCEKRAEKRGAPRHEGKETNSKKLKIKVPTPSTERQDGKKDREVKKSEKAAKSADKVAKSRVKKEEKKKTLAKIQGHSEEVERVDLEKRQQNKRMEKKREEEERRERKRQEDQMLERAKKEKAQKQMEEEEKRRAKEQQENERLEQETREKEQDERREKAKAEKKMREKAKKVEEERRERERVEREVKAKEMKQQKEEEERRESEKVEREMREKELKQKEEEERIEKERLENENNFQKTDGQKREVENGKGSKKAPVKKATKKQTGAVNCNGMESQDCEQAKPKMAKRKLAENVPSRQAEKTKRRKVNVANNPRISMSTPEQVKRPKGNGRQSRKTNIAAANLEVPSTHMETENALELSSDHKKVQSSPDQISTEKLSHTSEELSISKNQSGKLSRENEVTSVKAITEGKGTVAAQPSSDIDSGTDSPTLDLSKPPCSKSQEGEDDEGIHSHDGGSDISDCASEVSYDSGLNGKLPETPTEELPSPTQLLSHTCVFCDRTFPLEMDYRRHLNRHLVNVYYLDAATQGSK